MEYQKLVAQSIEELRIKTAAHDQLWHLSNCDWSVDQNTGEIEFTNPKGMIATCPVQIIGTFDTTDSTWLWAWDNPSIEPSLYDHAVRLREYGESNGISDLTTCKLPATEDRCWEFTALACKLNDSQGGYRGPAGSTMVFMTFGQPELGRTTAAENGGCCESAVADDADDEFTSDIPADVRATLIGFIAALQQWELAAYAASEKDDSSETMEAASESYLALIRQWCVADLEPQSIAYGSDPKHDPEKERLISSAMAEDSCRVRTQHEDSTGFVSDYEYHLRRENERWLIENLLYVADGEKYEML